MFSEKKDFNYRKKDLDIWSVILYLLYIHWKMLAGSRSCSSLREELSLASSWTFYLVGYICRPFRNQIRLYRAFSISLSLFFIHFVRLCCIVYAILSTINAFIQLCFFSFSISYPILSHSKSIAMSTFDINCGVLISFLVPFDSAVFKENFSSVVLLLKSILGGLW